MHSLNESIRKVMMESRWHEGLIKPIGVTRRSTDLDLHRANYKSFQDKTAALQWIKDRYENPKEYKVVTKTPRGFPSLRNYYVIPVSHWKK